MQSHIAACCDSFSTTALLVAPTSPCNSPPPSEPSGSNASGCSNAFSILMSSNKENNAWKEAETVEDRNFRPTKANGGRRKAPFYKVLQGMPIAVDAFRYGEIPGVTSYFLTCVFVLFCTMFRISQKHIFHPGTRIRTTTPIYRRHGRLARFTARVRTGVFWQH